MFNPAFNVDLAWFSQNLQTKVMQLQKAVDRNNQGWQTFFDQTNVICAISSDQMADGKSIWGFTPPQMPQFRWLITSTKV